MLFPLFCFPDNCHVGDCVTTLKAEIDCWSINSRLTCVEGRLVADFCPPSQGVTAIYETRLAQWSNIDFETNNGKVVNRKKQYFSCNYFTISKREAVFLSRNEGLSSWAPFCHYVSDWCLALNECTLATFTTQKSKLSGGSKKFPIVKKDLFKS